MEKINNLNETDRFIIANHIGDGNPFKAARYVSNRLGINSVDAEAVAEKIARDEGIL